MPDHPDDWGAPVHADDWSDPVHHDGAGTRDHPLDDVAHAAGAGTIARASLAPDIQVQLKRYAEAFKQPVSDFGIVGDHIVRRVPETGEYARVQPSVSGATGPLDAAKRAMDWVASGAGPMIPAVAAGGGAALAGFAGLETGPGALAAASAGGAAGAAAGEVARQKLDAALAPKGDEAPMDYGNIGWQAAAGLTGPAAGKVIGKVIGKGVGLVGANVDALADRAGAEMAPAAAGEIAPKSFGLSPRVTDALKQHIAGREAELTHLREDAQALGVDLSLGQMTGSEAVKQAERQLIRQPETVQAVADLRKAQNSEQIPGAVRSVLDDLAPDAPAGQQVAKFREAAEGVIDKTFKDQSAAARPVYAAALDGKPPFWSDDIAEIMKRPSMQAGLREAQKDAAEEGRTLPKLIDFNEAGDPVVSTNVSPSWRDWQNIKVGLNNAIKAETDPVTGKMTPDGRRLVNTKSDLMGILYKANPDWQAADAAYGSASDLSDAVLKGGVGFLNKMSGPDRQNMVNRVFSGQNLMPEEIAAMRRQFAYAGKSAEWNDGLRSYIADKLADAVTPLKGGGEPANVGGAVYKSLFEQRQSDILKAAMGGDENEALVNRWNQLGRVLKAASNQLPEGSATATDTGAPGLVSRAIQGAKYILHPVAMGADLMDGLAKMQEPEEAKKLAQLSADPGRRQAAEVALSDDARHGQGQLDPRHHAQRGGGNSS
jgi:hypothetical protein